MFREGLMKQHSLLEVTEPHWIKPTRHKHAKPLLLSFIEEFPRFIDVPGENMRTQVYEYKERPLLCKTCVVYGHSKNRCQEKDRCIKCGKEVHKVKD